MRAESRLELLPDPKMPIPANICGAKKLIALTPAPEMEENLSALATLKDPLPHHRLISPVLHQRMANQAT